MGATTDAGGSNTAQAGGAAAAGTNTKHVTTKARAAERIAATECSKGTATCIAATANRCRALLLPKELL